jgi:hypothetical protein
MFVAAVGELPTALKIFVTPKNFNTSHSTKTLPFRQGFLFYTADPIQRKNQPGFLCCFGILDFLLIMLSIRLPMPTTIRFSKEVVMNKTECFSEKISARTLGLFILPFALALALVGGIILPIIGFFFALPLLVLSGALLFAPESKTCRLITVSAKKVVSKT